MLYGRARARTRASLAARLPRNRARHRHAGARERVGAAGIDRVSLGVQSFVQSEIARTGRKHTAAIVAAEIGPCCGKRASARSTST